MTPEAAKKVAMEMRATACYMEITNIGTELDAGIPVANTLASFSRMLRSGGIDYKRVASAAQEAWKKLGG